MTMAPARLLARSVVIGLKTLAVPVRMI